MKVHILGIPIDKITTKEALKKINKFLSSNKSHYIVTSNPEMLVTAQEDKEFREILERAELSIPDGVGLIFASWILGCPLWHRVAGVDFVWQIAKLAEQKNCSIYLLGGKEKVAKEAAEKLRERYSKLRIVGAESGPLLSRLTPVWVGLGPLTQARGQGTSGYPKVTQALLPSSGDSGYPLGLRGVSRSEATKQSRDTNQESRDPSSSLTRLGAPQDDPKGSIERVNQAKPDILLVAFGAPKQEKWIYYNLPQLPSLKLAMGVGGAFDFIAQKVKRAPYILRRLGLEWLWRLIQEPWRWRRIVNATFKFSWLVLKWRVRMWFKHRENVVGFIYQVLNLSESVRCHWLKPELLILIVQRLDDPSHWQLPQGGIDKGETKEGAILRELKEELGTDKFKIVRESSRHFYKYIWPKNVRLRKGYKGQKQTIFYLEFLGQDKDIKLDREELIGFRWVKPEELIEAVHDLRKEMIIKALRIFKERTL